MRTTVLPGKVRFRTDLYGENPYLTPKTPYKRFPHTVAHDPMGNRQSYNNVNQAYSYSSNNLNQYTAIFNPDGSAQNPSYDENGNLIESDSSHWSYSFDDENRLVGAESRPALDESGKKKLEFAYDGQGRRRIKKVYSWTGSAWQFEKEVRFIYDNWNLLAELDNSDTLQKSYIWGIDLSGSEQKAGGVGGLLSTSSNSCTNYTAFDGNGNITVYFKNDSSIISKIEYSPFGKVISETGTAPCNFKYSTKYQDLETGLFYYGYRYYDAATGRWINRDPLGEMGGINLYSFIDNNTVNIYDFKGLLAGDEIQKQCTKFAEEDVYQSAVYCKRELELLEEYSGWVFVIEKAAVVDMPTVEKVPGFQPTQRNPIYQVRSLNKVFDKTTKLFTYEFTEYLKTRIDTAKYSCTHSSEILIIGTCPGSGIKKEFPFKSNNGTTYFLEYYERHTYRNVSLKTTLPKLPGDPTRLEFYDFKNDSKYSDVKYLKEWTIESKAKYERTY